ncbi:MAG: hemerythrin domain-containing protein [Dehalococcoidia bacterium]
MPGPLGAIRFVHAPIRNDLAGIKQELAPGGSAAGGDIPAVAKRFAFLETFLTIHESTEEEFLFPAIDAKAPGASKVYEAAHREMDGLRAQLRSALEASNAEQAYLVVTEIMDKMTKHLDQEEQELLALCDQHIPVEEQGAIGGKMSAHTPQDQAPAVFNWIFKNQGQDEREGFLRMLGRVMPPPAFQGVKGIAQGAVSPSDWEDLTKRVPELQSS